MNQEELKSVLSYNEDTGIFTWNNTGKIAGTDHNGYIRILYKKQKYLAHRLAWLYIYGSMPIGLIDHINCIRSDNSIYNLREATNAENKRNAPITKNNTHGVKGVYKVRDKWRAQSRINGITHHLGYFKEFECAVNAYKKFAKDNYGEFYRE